MFWLFLFCFVLFLLPLDSPSVASLKVGQGLLPQHESLLLHPSVLEPDLHLLVAEIQPVGELPPPLPGDELVQHEFTFELRQLEFGIRFALLSGPSVHRVPRGTWKSGARRVGRRGGGG